MVGCTRRSDCTWMELDCTCSVEATPSLPKGKWNLQQQPSERGSRGERSARPSWPSLQHLLYLVPWLQYSTVVVSERLHSQGNPFKISFFQFISEGFNLINITLRVCHKLIVIFNDKIVKHNEFCQTKKQSPKGAINLLQEKRIILQINI